MQTTGTTLKNTAANECYPEPKWIEKSVARKRTAHDPNNHPMVWTCMADVDVPG